jgi:serine/threonine protein kinase
MDFGLATASQSQALRLTSATVNSSRGTLRWQAPELSLGSSNSVATDIYAFACVCYEVF